MKSLTLNRNLQIWRYSPSFSRLLLVANKEDAHKGRVAIVLQGTKTINLPTYFHCNYISREETKTEETEFHFHSNDEVYIVKALRLDYSKDELEFDNPIPLFDNFFDER